MCPCPTSSSVRVGALKSPSFGECFLGRVFSVSQLPPTMVQSRDWLVRVCPHCCVFLQTGTWACAVSASASQQPQGNLWCLGVYD